MNCTSSVKDERADWPCTEEKDGHAGDHHNPNFGSWRTTASGEHAESCRCAVCRRRSAEAAAARNIEMRLIVEQVAFVNPVAPSDDGGWFCFYCGEEDVGTKDPEAVVHQDDCIWIRAKKIVSNEQEEHHG